MKYQPKETSKDISDFKKELSTKLKEIGLLKVDLDPSSPDFIQQTISSLTIGDAKIIPMSAEEVERWETNLE